MKKLLSLLTTLPKSDRKTFHYFRELNPVDDGMLGYALCVLFFTPSGIDRKEIHFDSSGKEITKNLDSWAVGGAKRTTLSSLLEELSEPLSLEERRAEILSRLSPEERDFLTLG